MEKGYDIAIVHNVHDDMCRHIHRLENQVALLEGEIKRLKGAVLSEEEIYKIACSSLLTNSDSLFFNNNAGKIAQEIYQAQQDKMKGE